MELIYNACGLIMLVILSLLLFILTCIIEILSLLTNIASWLAHWIIIAGNKIVEDEEIEGKKENG